MNKIRISLALIICIFIVSCEEENENINIENFTIEYSVFNSPVDYNYSAHIDNKGNLSVKHEHGLIDYSRVDTFLLDMSELDLLENKLESLVKIDLNSEYGFGPNKPTDLPVTKILYETGFKTDSTFIYYPDENELPSELELFFESLVLIVVDNDTLIN